MRTTKRKPTTWFVRQNQKVYGPFDSKRLKKLADAGKIFPTSEVTKQLPGPWAQAALVRGLFVSNETPEGQLPTVEFPEVKPGSGRWYFREMGKDDEQASGPHTRDDMERLIDRGTVRASTLVIQEGESQWETAFSSGLFMDDPHEEDEKEPKAQDGHPEPKAALACHHAAHMLLASEPEKVLWAGQPTHHAKFGTYALCALAAPLVLPAIWGIKKYAERDSTRYLITSRRVRIKIGAGAKKKRIDVPLQVIRDARMATPAFLKQTDVCNIELLGDKSSKPLVTLEGVPLDQSAFIISLCEAAVHRHIPMQLATRLVNDTKAQEAEIRRRAEERHRQEREQLVARARTAEERAERAEGRFDAAGMTSALLEGFAQQAMMPRDIWSPPPSSFRHRPKPVSGLTSWWFGATKRSRVVRVKGHYRGKTWVRSHDRRLN